MVAPRRVLKLALRGAALEDETPSITAPRCEHCGDVIGVYEPLVHVIGGIATKTSRAAQPTLSHGPSGSCYHALCFERRSSPP
jgi:hypothetical protein